MVDLLTILAQNGNHDRQNFRNQIKKALKNNKSFFLLGPRQAGKTTLVSKIFNEFSHIEYNLMDPSERLKFERNPSHIKDEILSAKEKYIFIDEVQKIPELLDIVQILIDKEKKYLPLQVHPQES